jgi:hypothetical protein
MSDMGREQVINAFSLQFVQSAFIYLDLHIIIASSTRV